MVVLNVGEELVSVEEDEIVFVEVSGEGFKDEDVDSDSSIVDSVGMKVEEAVSSEVDDNVEECWLVELIVVDSLDSGWLLVVFRVGLVDSEGLVELAFTEGF